MLPPSSRGTLIYTSDGTISTVVDSFHTKAVIFQLRPRIPKLEDAFRCIDPLQPVAPSFQLQQITGEPIRKPSQFRMTTSIPLLDERGYVKLSTEGPDLAEAISKDIIPLRLLKDLASAPKLFTKLPKGKSSALCL